MIPFIHKVLILLTGLFFITCHRMQPEPEPSAILTFEKQEYFEGETIVAADHSDHASSRIWILPDNRMHLGEQVQFIIPQIDQDRELEFKLEAFSESLNKSNSTSRKLKVKMQSGRLIFYGSKMPSATKVYVETSTGRNKIMMLPILETAPACGDTNVPFISIKEGHHQVKVFLGDRPNGNDNLLWSGYVDVTASECTKIKVN